MGVLLAVVALGLLTIVATYVVEWRRRKRTRHLAETMRADGITDPRGLEGPIGAEGHFRTGVRPPPP